MDRANETQRTAIVTGVSGQDGIYLARTLLANGWRVIGTVRPGRSSIGRMAPYLSGVEIVEHDLVDAAGFVDLLDSAAPHVVFNLAAVSAVTRSWSVPGLVARTNLLAVGEMLESIVRHRDSSGCDIRFFQASTAEIFGRQSRGPLAEDTTHRPRTPYAVAKSAAHHLVIAYRERYGLFASNAVLFNHESPFRGQQFIAGRIARVAAAAACGQRATVALGNLDIQRDWGAAVDYVEAMAKMMDHDTPGDFVVASGATHTLRDMLTVAFASVGLDDASDYVELQPQLWSSTQSEALLGDPSKARRELGWTSAVSFEQLVSDMVAVELRRIRTGVAESASYMR